jgi:hypothetical protein
MGITRPGHQMGVLSTHFLTINDSILDLTICGISEMWLATAAILVVIRVVVLMTTLKPYSTSGGYLLSSGSMSGFV